MSTPTTEADSSSRRKRERKAAPAPEAPVPVAAPIKQRRRPMLIGLGAALVALGGVGAAYLATSVSNTVQVIVVNEDVPRGTVIGEEDLGRADITLDPSVDAVAYDKRDEIIGQTAAFDLETGSLLTSNSYSAEAVPGPGETVVGVAVTKSQLPANGVTPGADVRIVFTPKPQDEAPEKGPLQYLATVVGTREDPNTGVTVVDVVLDEGEGMRLAAWVATGRIAITLANPDAAEEG